MINNHQTMINDNRALISLKIHHIYHHNHHNCYDHQNCHNDVIIRLFSFAIVSRGFGCAVVGPAFSTQENTQKGHSYNQCQNHHNYCQNHHFVSNFNIMIINSPGEGSSPRDSSVAAEEMGPGHNHYVSTIYDGDGCGVLISLCPEIA